MPFTLAHVAVAPPLLRPLGRFAHPAALGIGCVAPDLAYMLPGNLAHSSHSPLGLIVLALPLGLLAFVLWHRYTLPGLLLLTPQRLRARLHSVGQQGKLIRAQLPAILLCLLVGAVGHAFVDSFTHAQSQGVQTFPILQSVLVEWRGHSLRVYKALQHGGSLLGMTFLACWCWRWLQGQEPREITGRMWTQRQQIIAWVALLAATAVVGLTVGAIIASSAGEGFFRFRVFVVRSVVFGGATFIVGASVLGLVGARGSQNC
ncbi:MAG: hypothetical protein ACI8W8_002404 [Rhodothermales bacterium]|jgi:hypothetical protein